MSRHGGFSMRDRDPLLYGVLCVLPVGPLFGLVFGLRYHSLPVGVIVGLVALVLTAACYPLGRALDRRNGQDGDTGFAPGLHPGHFPEVRHALRLGEPPADPLLADALLYSAQRTLVLTGRLLPFVVGIVVLEVPALIITVLGYNGDPQRLAADLLSILALTSVGPALTFRARARARRAEQAALQLIAAQQHDAYQIVHPPAVSSSDVQA